MIKLSKILVALTLSATIFAVSPAGAASINGWSNGWYNSWSNGWSNGWYNGWSNGVATGQNKHAEDQTLRVIGIELPR